MIAVRAGIAVLLLSVFPLVALAEEHGGKPGERSGQGGPGVLSLLPSDSVTEHAIDTPAG